MPRSASGNGITDPVQIRALRLITPKQFGILVGHGETTVQKWIRVGWVEAFTALDTSNVLIRIEEIDRFLAARELEQFEKRKQLRRRLDIGTVRHGTPSTNFS